MKKTLLLLLVTTTLFSQEKFTLSNGKQILLHKDFTWEYFYETEKKKENINCEIEQEYDKFTKSTILYAKSIIVSDDQVNGIAINMQKNKVEKDVILSFIFVDDDINCIDDKDVITFLFDDNKTIQAKNQKEFNCEGRFVIYLGKDFGTQNLLDKLCNNKVLAIRLSGKSFYTKELDIVSKQKLIDNLNCLKN